MGIHPAVDRGSTIGPQPGGNVAPMVKSILYRVHSGKFPQSVLVDAIGIGFELFWGMAGEEQHSPPVSRVEHWKSEITRIWQPTELQQERPRSNGGYFFFASLPSGMLLHLGTQNGHIDMCTLWSGDDYVLWDSVIGFCPTFPPFQPPSPLEIRMRNIVRCNLRLMGLDIPQSDEEKHS